MRFIVQTLFQAVGCFLQPLCVKRASGACECKQSRYNVEAFASFYVCVCVLHKYAQFSSLLTQPCWHILLLLLRLAAGWLDSGKVRTFENRVRRRLCSTAANKVESHTNTQTLAYIIHTHSHKYSPGANTRMHSMKYSESKCIL